MGLAMSNETSVTQAQLRAHAALQAGFARHPATRLLLASILVAHIAVGLVMLSRGRFTWIGVVVAPRGPRLLSRCGAMNGELLDAGELWRTVSMIFLHGDGTHIFLNGIALFALGRLCEAVYGSVRFTWLFLLSGVGGGIFSWLGGNDLSVGASGGIFGLLGAAFIFGWRHRADLPEPTGAFFRKNLAPWIALNLFIGIVVPFIDNLGHTGGLVTGGILALVLGNRVVPGQDTGPLAKGGMVLGILFLVGVAAIGVGGKWL